MRLQTALYSVLSQFLPGKFREISEEDLALALRLNAELCVSAGGVTEVLEFADIMQVIGKDDVV